MVKSFAPEQTAPVVNGSIWTLLAIATIFLGLRLYCRVIRSSQLWWDDHILVASWALMLASSAILTESMRRGALVQQMSPPVVFLLMRISHTCHLVSLALSKTSFAVTLLRFSSQWQKYVIWFIIGSIGILFTCHVFLLWRAMCQVPDPWVLPGTCWSGHWPVVMNITTSMYSAVTDFVLAALPWKVIMGLNMKKAEKISVAVAMSVGILAGLTGVMKSVQSILTLDPFHPEFTYNLVIFWIFSLAEPNTTIIAASIPVLRVLVRDYRNNQYYGNSGAQNPSANGYLRSGNNSKFPTHGAGATSHAATVSGPSVEADLHHTDNGSDRSILYHSSQKLNSISRTTEVTVEVDGADGNGQPGRNGGGRGHRDVEEFEMQATRVPRPNV